MLLPYRTLAAALIVCGTSLSCVALPIDPGAIEFGTNAFTRAEWRNPDDKASKDSGNLSAREEPRYSRYRHYRHHRHHRRGRHHHRFFFF
jgi:hypothetical protein